MSPALNSMKATVNTTKEKEVERFRDKTGKRKPKRKPNEKETTELTTKWSDKLRFSIQ